MKKIGIFGVGSSLGDDGLGFVVCDRLQAQQQPNWQIEKLNTPTLLLTKNLDLFSQVYIVDAIKSDDPIGTLHCFSAHTWPSQLSTLSTHGVTLQDVIAIGDTLKKLPQSIIVAGISINQIDKTQFTLSPTIDNACDELADQINESIRQDLVKKLHKTTITGKLSKIRE